MRQLIYTMFISNNRILLHLRRKENLIKHQKVSKYYENICLQNFLFLCMSLLKALIVKNNHIETKTYFFFLKKLRKTNLKVFLYQILTSVKRSEKQLPSKSNFSTFLQFNCFNFSSELCERPYCYHNCQRN